MTKTRRRRIVIWSGVALLLSLGSYMTAYYETVIRTTRIRPTHDGMLVS